ncbi:MAG: hypothetical protein KDH91_09465 [Rhodoferax sp.]|nr:hypothetical protein [Rhodoferax sp.]
MGFVRFAAVGVVIVLTQGCASVMNDTTNPVRFETYAQSGAEVKDMECKIENDYGSQTVRTPGTLQVRRSSKDLQIVCSKAGEADAKGVATSRANGGMFGNIILGGGIGAIIDHNKGTAYTYPQWIRLVVGKVLGFDRTHDKDGTPNLGTDVPALPPKS